MTLRFKNSVQPNFQAALDVACSYQEYIAPTFKEALAPVKLLFDKPERWALPAIQPGVFAVSEVKFEPDAALGAFLTFQKDSSAVTFSGDVASVALAAQSLKIKYALVDANQIETVFTQEVTILACRISQADVDALQRTLSSEPLAFSLQAGKTGFKSLSYRDKIDQITRALSFDSQKQLCGSLTVELVTADSFFDHDAKLQTLLVSASASTKAETVESARLQVRVSSFALQIPIKVDFFACTVASLSFEKPFLETNYTIGSGSQQVQLSKVKQRPDCGLSFDQLKVESIQSDLPVGDAAKSVTLDSARKVLVVASNDTSLAGHSVKLSVVVDQSEVSNAKAQTV